MDKLTDFADKMFLIKGNQLTGFNKHSTNILGRESLTLLFRDYKDNNNGSRKILS